MANFRVEKVQGFGGTIPMDTCTTDSGVSVTEGDMLFRQPSDGLVRAARATDSELLGMAAEGITGATGVRVALTFVPALETVLFSGHTDSGIALDKIGTEVDIVGASGSMEVDIGSSSTDVLRITGIKDGSAAGDSGYVLFVVERSQYTGQRD